MLVLVLGILAASLIWWLFVKREKPVGPVVRWALGATGIVVLGLMATLRAGPLAGLLVVAVGSIVLWLAMFGTGDDGPGGGGPDPPPEPDPDPGHGERPDLPVKLLDPDEFDRARAEWEHELPKRS